MPTTIVVRVECDDDSDAQWLTPRVEGAVVDAVELAKDEGRLDGNVETSYEVDYGD